MDNKIIEVLRTFNAKELRRFGEFVQSPYFNKNKNISALFKALSDYHPEYKNRNLTIENIHKKVFPGVKYNYYKIHNIISDLYKLAEKYLAQLGNEKREYSEQRAMIPEFRLRALYKIYEQKFTSFIKELIDRPVKDENYFYYLYEMNDDYMYYTTKKKPNRDLGILQNEFDNFFTFSLIRLLKFYSLMLHEKIGHNVEYNLTMYDEIISYLQNNKLDANPTLQVFANSLLLLNTKDKKYYEKLKQIKQKHFDQLIRADQYLLFMHLYDFCAYMLNFKNDNSYDRDMFEIFREWIEKQFMTKDDFHYQELMNVVKMASIVNEFEYAENLIKEFEPYIKPEFKEDVLSYCCGQIEYFRGNYRKSLELLSKANFQNFLFKVQIKIIMLQSYYHLGMYEQAFLFIDSFRHFVSREQNLVIEHRESYYAYLNLLGDLMRLQESGDKKEFAFGLAEIKKQADLIPTNPFRIKLWLLNEIEPVK